MFARNTTKSMLDAEIQSALAKLEAIPDKSSKEYGALVEHINTLYRLKVEDRFKRLSPDTVLIVAANIFGILWLARYERENVIKSRTAMGHVMKPRS